MDQHDATVDENLDLAWQKASLFSSLEGKPLVVEKAGFWRRFAAITIDWLIIGSVSRFVARSLLAGWHSEAAFLLDWFLGLSIPAIYFIWPYSRGGQTLGKLVLGLRVVSVDGGELNWQKGTSRTLGYIPSILALYLGFLWAIWDRDKQAWQDKVAGTLVVRSATTSEQLQCYADPAAARRRQIRWRLGLGIPTAIIIVSMAIAYVNFIGTGISQVTALGDWPSGQTLPAEAVDVDLSDLGLRLSHTQDARDEPTWEGGQYDQGLLVTFDGKRGTAVYIWALRYGDSDAASSDFEAVIDWAGDNCGFYTYRHLLGKGLVDCSWSDAHNKILLNQKWILDVTALSRNESKELVDKILESISDHWNLQK